MKQVLDIAFTATCLSQLTSFTASVNSSTDSHQEPVLLASVILDRTARCLCEELPENLLALRADCERWILVQLLQAGLPVEEERHVLPRSIVIELRPLTPHTKNRMTGRVR